jgi:dihydroneopterin aldolase/2-amino-4-hydroxy-6-hydroxymethyldihydropteridine diphosphokinase
VADHILINDLRFESIIGVLDHERLAPQPLRVDVDIEVDLHDAGVSDDLEQTVHYGEVAVALANLARDTQYLLLERLAQHMAEVVLSFPLVRAVELTLTKLRPPIPEQIDSTAVRIRRVRAEMASVKRHRAVVALGSNLGNREAHLRFAIERLGESVVAQSQVFETDPVGGPDGQGAYLNMAVVLETELDPYALLRWLHRIEADAGRERVVHWGPRTLDLDLLFFDDVVITGGNLAVPHPRYAERRFVLAPLSEVAPEKCPAGWDRDLPPDAVYPRGPLV